MKRFFMLNFTRFLIIFLILLTGCAAAQFTADLARTNPRGFADISNGGLSAATATESPEDNQVDNSNGPDLEWWQIVLNVL